jgi:hypothetical protein
MMLREKRERQVVVGAWASGEMKGDNSGYGAFVSRALIIE